MGMRLWEFSLANREPILEERETFARSCKPASSVMDVEALRDHANDMLTAIAKDLATPIPRWELNTTSVTDRLSRARPTVTSVAGHGALRTGFAVASQRAMNVWASRYVANACAISRFHAVGGFESLRLRAM